MGTNLFAREQRAHVAHVTAPVVVAEINKHLSRLRSPKEVLLIGFEKGRQLLLSTRKSAGEAVVEKTLVTEAVAPSVKRQYTCGNHHIEKVRRKCIETHCRNGEF